MAGWVLPTATAGLEEISISTALSFRVVSIGFPFAITLTPRRGLGLDRLPCLPLAVPRVLSEEDTRGVVEDDPRAEGVVNGLTVVDPCNPADLCELLAMGKL